MQVYLRILLVFLTLTACGQNVEPEACDQRVALANTPDFSGACVNAAVDWADGRCVDLAWNMPACSTSTVLDGGEFGENHVPLPTPITYSEDPPMSGSHRAEWPNFGEYGFLPKQRWLHNLEHGGIAILYHPCAPVALVNQLRRWAQNVPNDDGGPFRWVLTPYPNLDSPFSVVAWKHRLKGVCFDADALDNFRKLHYRKSAEDVPYDGGYTCTWIGKSCGESGDSADATSSDGR